jgi:hypothetical protein
MRLLICTKPSKLTGSFTETIKSVPVQGAIMTIHLSG